MFKRIKIISFCLLASFLAFTPSVFAQESFNDVEIFKARVVEVIERNENIREDGSISIQQKIKLKGLEGDWKDKEVIYDGTGHDVIASAGYELGDKVLVNYSPSFEGEDNFYIVDYVRQGSLYWLIVIFALIVVLIGRLKGLRALVVLALTFLVILKFIIPQIMAGNNPLLISIIGSLFILVLAIYITEGLNKSSSLSIVSILISLIITGLLAIWFTEMSKLSGFADEDVLFLVGMTGQAIDIKGLFLAGVIIGSLGVLDDVVIAQVALVKELKAPRISNSQVYKKAMKVGISHLSSMVNTLFLAYAGVALPLFILFSLKSSNLLTYGNVMNNEMIAVEIVRTLVGSIGLVLAVPISTFLAVRFLGKKK